MSRGTLAANGAGLWAKLRGAAVDLVYPPQCAACAEELEEVGSGPVFCPACAAAFSLPAVRCPACALPTSSLPAADGRCVSCRRERPAFAAARVLGDYEDRLRDAVLKIKHDWYEPLAVSLGRLLARRIEALPLPARPDFVVPVPMHWLRRIWRGASATQTLAETIAAELRWPLGRRLVTCQRLTARQSSLRSASERKDNVKDAYRAVRARSIDGATILVVDDVITTGATCDEVARVLRRAGAKQVFAAAVARAGT